MMRSGLCLVIAAMLAGCATPPAADRSGSMRYAFVVLGEEGRPVARVITAATACPKIELDGVGAAMDVRAHPATIPLRPTRNEPAESKPSAFPVLVCEKAIPASARRAVVAGRALPLPKASPQWIVVVGDTGCRIKMADRVFQACNDTAQWPFAAIAGAAMGFVREEFRAVFPDWSFGRYVAVAVVLSIVGQLGDLAESAMKRDASVKDSGNFLPGHGGVLDRCDSYLFAAPVLYYLAAL